LINYLIIFGLVIIFTGIIVKLVHDKKSGCSVSCSGCPLAKQCNKVTIKADLKELLHK